MDAGDEHEQHGEDRIIGKITTDRDADEHAEDGPRAGYVQAEPAGLRMAHDEERLPTGEPDNDHENERDHVVNAEKQMRLAAPKMIRQEGIEQTTHHGHGPRNAEASQGGERRQGDEGKGQDEV